MRKTRPGWHGRGAFFRFGEVDSGSGVMDLRPGMIEFAAVPGAVRAVSQALRATAKSRGLRRAWNATLTAGHLGQVKSYSSWATRKADPVADWVARRIG